MHQDAAGAALELVQGAVAHTKSDSKDDGYRRDTRMTSLQWKPGNASKQLEYVPDDAAKAPSQTAAACIFVRIPRNLTRSSITPRSGKGGSAALPPGTAGRAFVWRGILGVSGGGSEKWPPSFPCRESTLEG